ncbi:MAG: HlyC/CorC family transporter [Sandaracinus sp.]|nr:HlyC/CorC family transporter [Sandaracinus sp.]MCB9615362.1 HlyC/CorC family transporter [Sandaracinus sp.]MCB9634969.1 HlyC/CorC family transporter [Sandaracinus sp.]
MELAFAIVGGLITAAVYSAANGGVASLGDGVLHAHAEGNDSLGREAKRLIERGRAVRARLLIGRVLALSVAAGSATLLPLPSFWWRLGAALGVALVYGMLAHVAATAVAQRGARGALKFLRGVRPLELAMAPLAAPLGALGALTERLIPRPRESGEVGTLALEHLIERGEEAGTFAEEHADMLRSVLEFRDTVAREVMVPRTQVEAFAVATPLAEVAQRVEESGHSRYPVFRDSIDHVEGVLYAKDLFRWFREGGNEAETLESLIRKPALFIPETRKIDSILREMQQRRFHLGVVVDEFGGVAGIVTLEDILEEIVGEIDDELDEAYHPVAESAPGRFVADADVSVYDLNEFLDEPIDDGEGDYDSLGGMIVQLAGRVPQVGEEVQAGRYDLRVLEADDRHVQRVEIVRKSVVDAAQ